VLGKIEDVAMKWKKIVTGMVLAGFALFAASRCAAQKAYISPGANRIFRMDSSPGALLEFLVLLALVVAGVMVLARVPRAGRVFGGIAGFYIGAVVLVSLMTPRTIVSVGDSYCWDLWCLGIQKVNATPQGQNVLYTAEVSLFADSTNTQRLPADPSGKQFFYVTDERGRRFPIVHSSFADTDIIVAPGESVKSVLTFVAPEDARNLYLTSDVGAPPWVRLYFGSDLNPFHRCTLLRVV
jgi:hypothetical protein